jgi:hypothetical protein
MGSTTKYRSKELCTVTLKVTPIEGGGTNSFIYAYYTNIPTTARTKLGITTVTPGSELPNGTVMGCSYPKPPRASKREVTRSTTSFVSHDGITAAKLDDWKIRRFRKSPSLKLGTNSNELVRTVYVTIKGIKYAWNIPKVTLAKIESSLTDLGIQLASSSDAGDLCFGANYPKPPRASKAFGTDADDLAIVSTFYDPDKTLPSGWSTTDTGILLLTA